MNNIYLVGFMGTGKTSVGRQLVKKKKLRFVDLDELIETKQKRSIADIFAKEGEPYFRKLEHETLKEAVNQDKLVVACGGGIVINPENIKLMQDTGTIICLTAKPEVILDRTSNSQHRPLLNIENPKEKISALLQARAPFYAKADITIDTSELLVDEVVQSIEKYFLRVS